MDFLISHLLRTSAARLPAKEALVCADERLTYAEVLRRVTGLAHGLQECGVSRGDRVGIFLEPSIAQTLSIFAVSQASAVFVPINAALFPDQVAHIARDCAMTALITTRKKLGALTAVRKEVPSLRFCVVLGEDADAETTGPLFEFDELCRLPGPGRESGIEKDLAAILYTSGSTGRPKGVMLSHAQILAGASIVSTYLEITEAERILAALPFSFDAGLNQVMTAFQQGGACVIINFVFAREIVETLVRERISGLAGVPTLWGLLAQPSSTLARRSYPHLRYITNTGGAMPQTVLQTLLSVLPTTRIFLMYGLTEAFRSTYLPPEELDRRPTSMGKAIPNTEILVVDEAGQPCRPGQVGELVHRGPTVSMGYWGQPELTEGVLRPHPFLAPELGSHERVCYSGDLVKMDDDGFLYFVARRDAMIKTSGFRVSPTEVEEVLFESGLVRGAAVIGIPDEVLGQHIKALVVPRTETPVDAAALIEFCAARLPRYMVPKHVEILEELPKTGSGKVDYPSLRRREGL